MNKRWIFTHLLPIFLVVILVGGITIAAVPSFKDKFVGYIKQFGPKADETSAWQITTVIKGDNFRGINVQGNCLGLVNDEPRIVFINDASYSKYIGYSSYRPGQEWNTEIVKNDLKDPFWGNVCMKITNSGEPRIVYTETPNTLYNIYHDNNSNSWQTKKSDVMKKENRYSLLSTPYHISLDSSDNPHVLYIHYYGNTYAIEDKDNYRGQEGYSNNDSLNHAYFSDGSWHEEVVIAETDELTSFSGGVSGSYAAAIAPDDSVHVVYTDVNTSDKKIIHRKINQPTEGDIIDEVSSEDSVYGLHYNIDSVAIDSENHIHVVYTLFDTEKRTSPQIKYAYFDGTAWQIEDVDKKVYSSYGPTLALDSHNKPHISYLASNSYIKYAYKTDSGWKTESIVKLNSAHVTPSLSLDSQNKAHISYSIDGNLMYATNDMEDLIPPTSIIKNLDEFYNQQGLPKELTGTSSDASGVAKVEVKIQREDDSKFWDDALETWADEEKWHQAFGTNNWTWPIEKLANGLEDGKKYLVTFRATDASNKSNVEGDSTGKNQKTFAYDISAPSAPEKVNNGSDANEKWTAHKSQLLANWSEASDNISGITNYQYAIGTTTGGTDALDWTDNGNKTSAHAANLSLSENQTYYFSVRAVDKAGNVGTAITSDGIKVVKQLFPSVLISTSPKALINFPTPQIVGNAESWTDNISLIEYKIDNGEWIKLQPFDEKYDSTLELFNFNTPKLDEGQHIIYIRSTDSSGHITEESQYAKASFDLDLTKPAAPAISSIKSNEVLNTSRPTFSGTATPSNLILLTVSSEIRKYLTSVGLDGAWSYQVPEPLEEGAHSLQIVERDIAGNESDATTISFSVKTIEDIIPVPGAPAPISIITSAPTATSSTAITSTTAAPTSTSVSTTTSSAPTPSESTTMASTATTSAAAPTTSTPTSVFLPQPTFVENPTFPETIIIINNDEEIIKDSSQEEQKVSTKPNSKMEISVTPTHDDKTVKSVSAVFAGNTYQLTDKNNSGSYSTDLLSPDKKGNFPAKTTIAYDDGTIEEIQTTILVDALHGFIYEGKEKKIEGAKITLYVWQDNNWQVWQNESKQENPQITQNDGVYSFAAPAGKYYLTAEKQGHKTYKSKEMTIGEAGETELNIKLSKPVTGSIVTYAIILIIIGGAVLAYKKYSKKNSYDE